MLKPSVAASSSGWASAASNSRRASSMSSAIMRVIPARPACLIPSHTLSARKPREFWGPYSL